MTEIMSQTLIMPDEMRAVERLACAHGMTLQQLMENAGRAVAAEIISRYSKRPVTVLCGPGNNGGDGFVTARLLDDLGWDVSLHLLGDRSALRGEAALAAKQWRREVLPMDAPFTGAMIVDALFGIGLSRDFSQDLAERINDADVPVIACDIPSGLDTVDGLPKGAAVEADLTVTFFKAKPAHVLGHAKQYVGEAVVAEIGIAPELIAGFKFRLSENAPSALPDIAADAHKYSRGGAFVWSGPELQTGASRLAGLAAQKAGAGAVTILGPRDALLVHAHHVTSIMTRETGAEQLPEVLRDQRYRSVCVGPGAGHNETTRRAALNAVSSGMPTVLDADALTVFEDGPDVLFHVIKQRSGVGVVLTPHDGEFRRLFNKISTVSKNRVERAIEAAHQSGAVVVLKGPGTVIAHPDGRVRLQTQSSARLATAGSGDVLAGLITGLMAQAMPAFDAACNAVWRHAEAASSIQKRSIAAEDILGHLEL